MIYDFLAVPRNLGSYTIPAVEFTYYDTSKNAYKTIKTQPFTLTVEKGDGSASESADYSSKDKDIHTIKLGKTSLHQADDMFFGSFGYWTSLLIIAHHDDKEYKIERYPGETRSKCHHQLVENHIVTAVKPLQYLKIYVLYRTKIHLFTLNFEL